MSFLPQPPAGAASILCAATAIWVLSKIIAARRRRAQYTRLAGPPSPSLVLGVSKVLTDVQDAGNLFEEWSEKYGAVYRVPAALGYEKVVLCDPKAIQYVYARQTVGYLNTTFMTRAIENLTGRGVLSAEGEIHKRQRKALSPAFSNAMIRKMTAVFYDEAYKLKTLWDNILDAEPDAGAVILDIEYWMNCVSLDSIGTAGFSHDFGMLAGKQSMVATTLSDIANLNAKSSHLGFAMQVIAVIGLMFPSVLSLPTEFGRLVERLRASTREIALGLLENTRKDSEMAGRDEIEDKSVIGLLMKAEKTDSEFHMSEEELLAQMNVLILAGFETTSISLSWCLLELCKKPRIQQQLREELLSQFAGSDPTWDQLMNGLPFLDAVVHETLRLHPPLPEAERVATEDDVLPLSSPIRTADGKMVDSVFVPKGQIVLVPAHMMNRATKYWGPDAKEFKPERWMNDDGIPQAAREISGHRHLLTFSDGARICLGRHFAIAEFKAVLSVLVRNYEFELRGGPDTQTEIKRGILPRPRIAGEDGTTLPLKVRRAG